MITVFTPSCNRAYTLPRLFGSLQRQTCSDFEWVIVDDGSTDGTAELCEDFAKEARFPLRYVRQDNSGKHVAINRGAIEASGEWFFIVDSDDYLPPDLIEINKVYLSQISEDPRFAGVSGLRARVDGSWIIGQGLSLKDVSPEVLELFSREYIDETSQDYRVKFRMPGDRAEVVSTYLVRKCPSLSAAHKTTRLLTLINYLEKTVAEFFRVRFSRSCRWPYCGVAGFLY